MNILDEYKKVLSEEKKLESENVEGETPYRSVVDEFKRFTEEQLIESNNIFDEDVRLVVKKAKCPNCGEELVSKTPPMFNPYTYEKLCPHTCNNCQTKYNLEFAYPRIAIINGLGEEIPAFGR